VNLNLTPFVALWAVVTAIVIALFIWRKWGKIMTVIAVVLGILVAAAYVYGQFVGRPSMGA
jgi:hypothetical protein